MSDGGVTGGGGERPVDRRHLDTVPDEREVLVQHLDYHRATFLMKFDGLTAPQLRQTAAASSLHLAGLCKHLALVEHWWFREILLGEAPHPVFADVDWAADRDWEFRTAADDDPAWLRSLYEQTCDASREAITGLPLEHLSARTGRRDEHFNVRWILLHMTTETARHNGHADLLREAIDGQTGE